MRVHLRYACGTNQRYPPTVYPLTAPTHLSAPRIRNVTRHMLNPTNPRTKRRKTRAAMYGTIAQPRNRRAPILSRHRPAKGKADALMIDTSIHTTLTDVRLDYKVGGSVGQWVGGSAGRRVGWSARYAGWYDGGLPPHLMCSSSIQYAERARRNTEVRRMTPGGRSSETMS